MICEFCYKEFTPDKSTNCKGCQLGQVKCPGIRCPYCFYEMIPEPKWIQKLFEFFGFRRKKGFNADYLPLSSISVNQEASVTHLGLKNRATLKKMIALGILPGTQIKLVQRYPSYVFTAGETQFSLDHHLASSIYVKPSQKSII